jgi:D-tyrosyl-tRNA(Tyr) deacylase
VKGAQVTIRAQSKGAIEAGLLVFIGIEDSDSRDDADWLAGKIVKLRIFDDDKGVMNRSVEQSGGDILVVSQFTLHANVRKGNRPSYHRASKPDRAIPLYEYFVDAVERESGKPVQTGVFGAEMEIALVNDGPVTIFIDTNDRD